MTTPFPICGIHPVLDDPEINLCFEDILAMSDETFDTVYAPRMIQVFLTHWNESGLPPRRGWTNAEIDDEFKQLAGLDVQRFWKTDELTGNRVIRNTQASLGNAVNAWNAGNMYRTRINYDEKDNGRSIYDFFSKPELFARYLPYARRHFLRDSFYLFAESVLTGEALPHRPEIIPENAFEYLSEFGLHELPYGDTELLIEPVLKEKSGSYTGYGAKLSENKPLALSFADYQTAADPVVKLLRPLCSRNVYPKHLSDAYVFHIRKYTKQQRLFPALFRSFRISMCQYAVNFPPTTAKLLYETFLAHVTAPTVRVYDPSAGWAGRLVGAMSYNRQLPDGSMQQLDYYATDPNPAFYTEDTSVYRVIADRFNSVRIGNSLFDTPHTSHVLKLGSEFWNTTTAYGAFEGRGDLVFTSPPYFNREAYSEDEAQSYKRYSTYDRWRDEFLRPTLTHAYHWLNHERYLLWNIADLKVGKKYLPLEADSRAIAASLGFVFKETIFMALASMPGGNRIAEDGTATSRNSCKVDGKILKHEPVHVFWKP